MTAKKKGRQHISDECQWPIETELNYKELLPQIVDDIVQSCNDVADIEHLDATTMPSREATIELLSDIEGILFPGYAGQNEVESANLIYYIGDLVNKVFDVMSLQIQRCIRHVCFRKDDGECRHCSISAKDQTLEFLRKIPKLRKMLSEDVRAAYMGDPAAKGSDEIIFAYPGVKAITIYRVAHELHRQDIPILPRMMTEYAHTNTGVDIHPGARIGKRFFIDHGTGVVIGETCRIGNDVQLYQGVTLGALRLPIGPDGELDRDAQRHPTIKDHVTIYSGTTILGGETIVGEGSVVGGNIWLTHSIPAGTKLVTVPPEVRVQRNSDESDLVIDYSI